MILNKFEDLLIAQLTLLDNLSDEIFFNAFKVTGKRLNKGVK
jgi:hypothetical protein